MGEDIVPGNNVDFASGGAQLGYGFESCWDAAAIL